MKPTHKLTIPIAGLCIAAALFFAFRTASPPASNEAAAPSVSKMTSKHRPGEVSRAPAETQAEPTEDEVIRMTPADWETVFKTRYMDLDEEFKQEMIRSGAKPDEEEPQAFAQTILVLLNEKQLTQQ